MLTFEVLHLAQLRGYEVQNIDIVITIIDGVTTQPRKGNQLGVIFACHIHHGRQQMGRISLGKGIVHNQHLALISIGKNVGLVPTHVIQKKGSKNRLRALFQHLNVLSSHEQE